MSLSSQQRGSSSSVNGTVPGRETVEGQFIVHYLGAAMMDSRCNYSPQMMPWIIAEILRFTDSQQVVLLIKNNVLTVTSIKTGKVLFESHVWDCLRSFPVIPDVDDDKKYFGLIIRANEIYLHCRLLSASSEPQVQEILSTMKESSNNSTGTSGPMRSSSSPKVSELAAFSNEAVSFEVLYMGKLRMSYRKAPSSFIDDALEKFKSHETERINKERRDSCTDSRRSSSQDSESELGSLDSLNSTVQKPVMQKFSSPNDESDRGELEGRSGLTNGGADTGSLSDVSVSLSENKENCREETVHKSTISHPLEDVSAMTSVRARNPSGDSWLVKSLSLPAEPMRNRALSTGNAPRGQSLEASKISNSHYNRTMLLLVGRTEIRIISPDAKTTLFNKQLRDVFQLSQGISSPECFGFICRESGGNTTSYVAYVFRCQSDTVAAEILAVLKQAYSSSQDALKKERQIQSCDHCPMMWYSRMCSDIEGLACDDRIQTTIMKRIESLPEDDRDNILAKFHGAEPQSVQEQNELLMMLLRAHCESKQSKHIHDTAANRHEFLNQYLGLGSSVPMLMKAKKSITNSFDQLMKRKIKDQYPGGPNREFSLPQYVIHQGRVMSPSSGRDSPASEKQQQNLSSMVVSDSPLEKNNIPFRPRSSTVGALAGEKIRCEIRNRRVSQQDPSVIPQTPKNVLSTPNTEQQQKHSPMMNIFLKVGSQKPGQNNNQQQLRRGGSWRHAMFKRVVSPSTPQSDKGSPNVYTSSPVSSRVGEYRAKRTRDEIRQLWRTAIRQQILLIRMEKQNVTLKEKQQEANVKRSKLSYRAMGICDDEANDTWDLIISQASGSQSKLDIQLLNSALLRGIPKHKRGQVWQLFVQQRSLSKDDSFTLPNQDVPYEQLLRQLTSQQHAILIDLGRTFPNHPYFSSPLGSGQLALFNLLKAYSLLDADVNYCQGLSFVAGLLLMHLEEGEAFNVLKHIMIDLGAREHYKPDMLGLQVKLYQLTRLIHDHDSDIHLLLYRNDVLPSLYAAPWFLTMFASLFPVGFAVRVLDVVMLHGIDVMAKFALAIILDHKKELMECTGLEQIMECFKSVVTHVDSVKLDRYLKKVIEMESEKQMLTYAVEYSVMNDETFHAFLSDAPSPPILPEPMKVKAIGEKQIQTEVNAIVNGNLQENDYKDMIRCQNARITKLEAENAILNKDIQTVLRLLVSMYPKGDSVLEMFEEQSKCYSPEISNLALKYLHEENEKSLEVNGESQGQSNLIMHRLESSVKDSDLPLLGCDRPTSLSNTRFRSMSRESSVDDNSSSHGIPALDADSDDSDPVPRIVKNSSADSINTSLNINNIVSTNNLSNGSDVIFTTVKSESST